MQVTSEILHQKLKEFFGFDSFKGEQEAVIRHLIEGNNTFPCSVFVNTKIVHSKISDHSEVNKH